MEQFFGIFLVIAIVMWVGLWISSWIRSHGADLGEQRLLEESSISGCLRKLREVHQQQKDLAEEKRQARLAYEQLNGRDTSPRGRGEQDNYYDYSYTSDDVFRGRNQLGRQKTVNFRHTPSPSANPLLISSTRGANRRARQNPRGQQAAQQYPSEQYSTAQPQLRGGFLARLGYLITHPEILGSSTQFSHADPLSHLASRNNSSQFRGQTYRCQPSRSQSSNVIQPSYNSQPTVSQSLRVTPHLEPEYDTTLSNSLSFATAEAMNMKAEVDNFNPTSVRQHHSIKSMFQDELDSVASIVSRLDNKVLEIDRQDPRRFNSQFGGVAPMRFNSIKQKASSLADKKRQEAETEAEIQKFLRSARL